MAGMAAQQHSSKPVEVWPQLASKRNGVVVGYL